ncbi:MAG: DinB family protein [Armatimonadetes bacterium]|nr:DinB family protein [Armatimonadota bacterium]
MELIETTKRELIQAKDRMLSLLASTPDDKLNWKPSPTSRSILEVVAHTAHALKNIRIQMSGTPFPISTSAQAQAEFHHHDKAFDTREKAEHYLVEAVEEYIAFLDTLTESDLERLEEMPFGLGPAPLSAFIPAGYMHTMGHNAQIEYIQTIYGDEDWHFGF